MIYNTLKRLTPYPYLSFERSLFTSGVRQATVTSSGAKSNPSGIGGIDQPKSRLDRELIRNIGIIAHINAGKTTTTERILYHAGSTNCVGDVDTGNTVTDYLVQERDRGITITSAAVTYEWRKNRVNLIDTPGHVDFTIEVERSLSVLDGAVTILDASAGVEAQTITVWNQASKYKLPNIIFLNKTDKPQANHKSCLKELRSDLNICAGLVHLPVKNKSGQLTSIIDIVNRKLIKWDNPDHDSGSKYSVISLNSRELLDNNLESKLVEQLESEREKLIENLADCDELFANHVINCDKMSDVSGAEMSRAMRSATLDCKFSPVLIGSSFKYIGVQQLMDAIIDYLPSPRERSEQIMESSKLLARKDTLANQGEPCAFIFKIMHDKRLGVLSYLRVCNGELKRLQRLQNLETGQPEQIKKIYQAFADELREIDAPVCDGDIVVATGLVNSRTGDILVKPGWHRDERAELEEETLSKESTNRRLDENGLEVELDCNQEELVSLDTPSMVAEQNIRQPFQLLNSHIIVPKIDKMEPVYFCSIESPSMAQQLKLEAALACMSREDPSFSYEIDSLGVGTIRGMGKLHLEVARDRIQTEYGIRAILGPMQISYRETIESSANEELQVSRVVNSVKSTLSLRLYARPKPQAGAWTSKKLRLDTSGAEGCNLLRLRADHRKALDSGFAAAMMHGPALGYPVIDCDVLLLDFKANSRCGLPIISSAAAQCLTRALEQCSPKLLEPIMLLEVVAPLACNSSIVSDLTSNRRGLVLSTQARQLNNSIVVRARAPLATLTDYSEHLRILTSGRGSFSMELHNYVAMSDAEKRNIVRI